MPSGTLTKLFQKLVRILQGLCIASRKAQIHLLGMHPNASTGCVVWLTGLSGSGKSTLANGAARMLESSHVEVAIVDGDALRNTVCRDLGFSDADRRENIRRAGEVALEYAKRGNVAIVALISPFEHARETVRVRCVENAVPFALVHLDVNLTICEQRDPKGLYKRARAGQLSSFTGISSPYEPPQNPSYVIRTGEESEWDSIERVVAIAMELLPKNTVL
jgi:adenylylsulfate kinase